MGNLNNTAHAPRILLCVHQFFPAFSAGTEVLVLSTAKALRNAGYDVRIVTAALNENVRYKSDSYDFQGFTVHRIWIPYKQGRVTVDTILEEYYNRNVMPTFDTILDSFAPDIVHFFHFKNLTVSCLQCCLMRNIRTVFTPTDYWLICRSCQLLKPWGKSECAGPDTYAGNCMKHLLTNSNKKIIVQLAKKTPSLAFSLLSRFLVHVPFTRLAKFRQFPSDLKNRKSAIAHYLSKIDLILPPTLSIENLLLASHVSVEKIQPLKYAIEPLIGAPKLIAREPSKKRRFSVGYIATLVEHKGCHVLLNAIKSIDNEAIDVKIYGSTEQYPDYVKSLKSIAAGDQRVEFLGTFPHEQIGDVMSNLDVLIIPSIWRENAPLVLLNAIASGTPVIASNVTGITEYLNSHDNVLLFPSGDSKELAKILENSLKSYVTGADTAQRVPRVAGSPLQIYANALDDAYTRLTKASYDKMVKI
jgi:glycosyltransferase involved in cell wall biosynthesis